MEGIHKNIHFLVFLMFSIFISRINTETVTVSTSVGKIAGYTENVTADGVSKTITKFMSIPFAEPAVGQRRFQKPVPKAHFLDTFQATFKPPACFQASPDDNKRMATFLNLTEDCLILNIYVPHTFTSNTSLPVMVWIHGGGFVAGTSSVYQGDILSPYTNTIVVTVNYRLGMFGFLRSADGKIPGNQGLWDQHLALKWVHDNIAAFTGNPKQVTIFGESAGGSSVLLQALYPGNKGYFQKVIAESGAPLAIWSTISEPNAEEYSKIVGCNRIDNEITCLRSKSANDLPIPTMLLIDNLRFLPIVDGDFLPESLENIFSRRNTVSASAREFYSSLDILSGVNNFDGAVYILYVWQQILGNYSVSNPVITRSNINDIIIPYVIDQISTKEADTRSALRKLFSFSYTNWTDPDSLTSTLTSLVSLSNDAAFFYPAIMAAQAHAAFQRGRTYFYEYSYVPPRINKAHPFWLKGASHAEEVAMVFCAPLNASAASGDTEKDKSMSRAVATMWSNFARSGDPNMPEDVMKYTLTAWPEYSMTSQQYLEINSHMVVKERFYAKRMSLWSELVPEIKESRAKSNPSSAVPDLSGIIFGK